MSDQSVETPIDQTMLTGALRRPPSLVPWIIVGVTAGMLAALTVVLIRQVRAERGRADEAVIGQMEQTSRADRVELELIQVKARLPPLETQVKELTAERDELSARVRSLALDAAKSSPADPSAAAGPKPAKKAPVKKPAKKKKR